jgi:hypothetical protein
MTPGRAGQQFSELVFCHREHFLFLFNGVPKRPHLTDLVASHDLGVEPFNGNVFAAIPPRAF